MWVKLTEQGGNLMPTIQELTSFIWSHSANRGRQFRALGKALARVNGVPCYKRDAAMASAAAA
jgi:hypothetical protein